MPPPTDDVIVNVADLKRKQRPVRTIDFINNHSVMKMKENRELMICNANGVCVKTQSPKKES